MRIRKCFKIGFLTIITISVMYLFAMFGEDEDRQLADGVYEASNAMLDIVVTIKEGRIIDIEILEHRGGGEKYDEIVRLLADTIIQEQSTQVDAITGATVSSNALKQAVEEALEKATIGLGVE